MDYAVLCGAVRRILLGVRRWYEPRPAKIPARRMLVGAGALIRDGHGRILLVRQTYHRPARWFVPGGWVGRGETIEAAVAREVREELGLAAVVGRPLRISVGEYGELNVLFECHLLEGARPHLSDEVDRAEFFHPAELPPRPPRIRRWLLDAVADAGRTR
jgi:ADP-ribose pyrophosphatase YjhB (NUDIX family)